LSVILDISVHRPLRIGEKLVFPQHEKAAEKVPEHENVHFSRVPNHTKGHENSMERTANNSNIPRNDKGAKQGREPTDKRLTPGFILIPKKIRILTHRAIMFCSQGECLYRSQVIGLI